MGALRHRFAAATVIASLTLAAGCGSDAGKSPKGGFIAEANAICKRGNDAGKPINEGIAQAQQASDPAKVFKRLAELTHEGAVIFVKYVDELDALTPPASDSEKIKGWIAGQRRQLTMVESLSRALKAQDQTRVAKLSEQVDSLTQANNGFAARYGMAECAK